MIKNIYLDMDGVLCDFYEQVNNRVGPVKHIKDQWALSEVLGLTQEIFWHRVKMEGEDFWTKMPNIENPVELVKFLYEHGKVRFCTTPTKDSSCFSGKKKWLEIVFGEDHPQVIFIEDKSLLAKENTLLIDDNQENVDKFIAAGGEGLHVLSTWNQAYQEGDILNLVKEHFGCITEPRALEKSIKLWEWLLAHPGAEKDKAPKELRTRDGEFNHCHLCKFYTSCSGCPLDATFNCRGYSKWHHGIETNSKSLVVEGASEVIKLCKEKLEGLNNDDRTSNQEG